MLIIKIFALIFMAYEFFRITDMKRILPLMIHLEQHNASTNEVEKKFIMRNLIANPLFNWVLAFDLAYFLFITILLFTSFWRIGLIIWAMVFIKTLAEKVNVPPPTVWLTDCVLSFLVLGIGIVFA